MKNTMPTTSSNEPSIISASPAIGVLGAKGGVGTTTIALNLAATLSQAGIATTLIDANLQQPDVATIAGKEPPHSLMDLLVRMPNLDKQLFEACCLDITGTGLNLLSPPLSGEAGVKANLTQLANCFDSLRSYSDFWIIDLPHHLDKHLVTLADQCNQIILVFEATLAGVATCRRWLSTFAELGYKKEQVICLLNRAGSKYTSVEKELATCFRDEPFFRLPNASIALWSCSANGIPLVVSQPNHPYARAMTNLAEHISQPFLMR